MLRSCDSRSEPRATRPVPGKKAFVFISSARKKISTRRPAPPKHAPRSDADSAGCVPNSLSFATSHRFSKVTVQRAVHVWRGRVLAAAPADRLGEWVNLAPSSSSVTFPSRLSAPVSHGPSPSSGRRWKWMCFAGDGFDACVSTVVSANDMRNSARGLTAQLFIHYSIGDRWHRSMHFTYLFLGSSIVSRA